VYLAGQSLGAQPTSARGAVEAELEAWARLGVDAWFTDRRRWLDADGPLRELTAPLVGARPSEIATLNTLTVNLHLLLASFYRPEGRRRVILIDAPTFPSDRYAVESQLRLHGLDPDAALVVVRPTDDALVSDTDIEDAIRSTGARLAVAVLAGVNYATGQSRDVGRLTDAVHEVGAVAMWDLAHAVGNVPLSLHDWAVDAAAWCTYKYLNAGPGAIAQAFVHERHLGAPARERLAGWWGNDPRTRFAMAETFEPAPGADGWRISTPPILSLAPIRASLEIFDEVGMTALRQKSVRLTGFFEHLIDRYVPDADVLTPRDPGQRGAQLSLRLRDTRRRLAMLEAAGVIGDFREPDILRLAPVPLYNTYLDAWSAADALAASA